MKTYLDCIPCFLKQVLTASRLSGLDTDGQKEMLDRTGRLISGFSLHSSPPENTKLVHGMVKEYAGVEDPYKRLKKESTKKALGLYPEMRRMIAASDNPLLTAVELAIAGNIIDYGAVEGLDIDKELHAILNKEEESIQKESNNLFQFDPFLHAVNSATSLLYIGDNAGETVFDRALIETVLKHTGIRKVHYAVRSKPILNDAVIEDAAEAGLKSVAEVISSGSEATGTVLRDCTPYFQELLGSTDVVVSKGQGNYESLSEINRPIFFLLMAKCEIVARHLDCRLRDVLLIKND